MPTENGEFIAIFQKLLDASNQNQNDIAKSIGISPGHLSDIKQGYRLPSAEVLKAIAEFFELTERQTKEIHLAVARDKGFEV